MDKNVRMLQKLQHPHIYYRSGLGEKQTPPDVDTGGVLVYNMTGRVID